MSSGAICHGTVLAGRYRLEDLLAEREGAWFWRATDTVLARSVAVHAVLSGDPRAVGMLEAARISATITDPHLLRVLDCDDENGIAWVVNEWGDGISLDLMLQQGTLPPARAAWLTREVAEAIAAGHAQGVAHGRLNPEAVLVTHAGAVKLIGYVVDASLQTPGPIDPLYGDLDAREADVINLAGILYASLTGRWPGVARSSVPPAPRESRRPLRPRQVRAGIPRTLDAICDRVLHKEGAQHSLPIETAHEVAAALADYVGDPALVAPVDATAMHAEPPAPAAPAVPPLPDSGPETQAIRATPAGPAAEATAAAEATQAIPRPTPEPGPTGAWRTPDGASTPGQGPSTDPDATQIFTGSASGADSPPRVRADWNAPLPPFPEVPERPLFADTERKVPAATLRAQEEAARRRAREAAAGWGAATGSTSTDSHPATGAHATTTGRSSGPRLPDPATGSRDLVHDTPPGGPPPGFWPFDMAEDQHDGGTGKEGRGWLRTAVVVGVLLLLVVGAAIVINSNRQPDAPRSGSEDSPSATARATGPQLKLAGVRDFDPAGDPAEENPESAPNAIDGDPATSWQTMTYRGDPALGGLKPGVGLIVDLGADRTARSVSVQLKGEPTSFEVYAAPAGVTESPASVDQFDKVAELADASTRATVQLDPAPKTRYLLVWLTRLPAVDGGFRGEITDISVRS